jgi:hypothetical protein
MSVLVLGISKVGVRITEIEVDMQMEPVEKSSYITHFMKYFKFFEKYFSLN